MKKIVILLFLLTALAGYAQNNPVKYKETWTSLRQHQIPAWLEDAKFGIYCHWGVSTIYYQKGNENLSLDDAISKFTAEKFNAAEWADLFKRAGARFGGPVGWHGSKYLHWDSDLTEYNSVDMSPHIDIVGELEREIRKAGLKFFVSYHATHHQGWLEIVRDCLDRYHPDIFWVDASFGGTKGGHHLKWLNQSMYIGQGTRGTTLLSDAAQRDIIAHYYNIGETRGQEVQFIYKSFDIPPGVGMRDLENGLMDQIAYDTWMTDIDMNICPDWETHGWFYREGIPLRDANNIIDILVDIVSKNGVFLLNVPPLPDGTFTPEIVHTLEEVGGWLQVNGEAVYGASPWFIFGEGPTTIESGNYNLHHNDHFSTHHFTEQDIRFTVNGNYLYAICLGQPGGDLMIKSLTTNFKIKKGEIKSIHLVGSEERLKWEHNTDGLCIKQPEAWISPMANVIKIGL